MKRYGFLLVAAMLPWCFACDAQQERPRAVPLTTAEARTPGDSVRIIFVELGSVNCIPCRQMQPVMKSIEEKYGEQIQVIFHDVWKHPNLGRQYHVRLIPTQVFLDRDGKELLRHEGFLPEARIDALLISQGLKPRPNREPSS